MTERQRTFMKKVSVIIPTYKSDKTLRRAIDSVLSQTYTNIEVVVADDNDPDTAERKSTEALMEQYRGNERVIYKKHEKNKNGSAARNTAFRASTGDLIAFLDDDDYFLPQKTEKQVAFLEEHPEFGGCYCWREQYGEEVCGRFEGDLSYQLLSLDFTPYTSCVMIRREYYLALNGFDESYYRHQDFEFLLRFFEKYRMGYVPSVGVVISTNGVNNVPKGEKLYAIKEHFFQQFAPTIDAVTKGNKKQKQYIYCNHFVRAFKDLIRYRYFKVAMKMYINYRFKCGIRFWPLFLKLIFAGMRERFIGKRAA